MSSAYWEVMRDDLTVICVFVAINALAGNFLPCDDKLANYPSLRIVYLYFVDIIAFFGLRWRAVQPSLDIEFMGFRRRIRHTYRNWMQDRADAKERI